MSNHATTEKKPGITERGARIYRNINLLGAAALVGIGTWIQPLALVANTLAAVDVLQAAGAEALLRSVKKRRKK